MPGLVLGTNRWIYNPSASTTTFVTVQPKGKGWVKGYALADTNGCSCSQILTKLHNYDPVLYGDMNGHWKYGCSISVMNDFIGLINPNVGKLTGTWLLSVNGGTYMHDMFVITQNPDGTMSGHGRYPAGGPTYSYPYNWNMIGQLTGNAISMTITYQDGYTAAISGTIASDWNSMSGSAGTGGVTDWSATRV
jgi:hypothetical protein